MSKDQADFAKARYHLHNYHAFQCLLLEGFRICRFYDLQSGYQGKIVNRSLINCSAIWFENYTGSGLLRFADRLLTLQTGRFLLRFHESF